MIGLRMSSVREKEKQKEKWMVEKQTGGLL